jgi:ribonuclease-3
VGSVSHSAESIRKVESVLGYTFSDPALLERALTHASIADDRLESNERLEFLGDAVLGYVVCEELFRQFDDLLEGELTKIKSAVVSRQLCARIAKELGLDQMLSLGKGMQARDSLPSSLAAAVFESVIGAILLDGGIDVARRFILEHIAPHIEEAAASGHQQNFKSVLQQHAQAHLDHQPVYVLKRETGPDHAKRFEIAVQLGDRVFDSCWASSKKRAEQKAALIALEELGLIRETRDGQVVYVPEEMFDGQVDPSD